MFGLISNSEQYPIFRAESMMQLITQGHLFQMIPQYDLHSIYWSEMLVSESLETSSYITPMYKSSMINV